jgi:putative transposase
MVRHGSVPAVSFADAAASVDFSITTTVPPHSWRRSSSQTLRVLRRNRILICDRDRKWSAAVEHFLATAGVRMIRTPFLAPNCKAHAERFVRSIREECLDRVIPLGERHLRRTLADFVAHYHGERNHQGLENELIERPSWQRAGGPVYRRQRVGGLLSDYYRAAA